MEAVLEIRVRRVVRRSRRPREERASRERELCAGVDRFDLCGLVAALFCGALVDVALLAEPAQVEGRPPPRLR
jgi:hypothetical protein